MIIDEVMEILSKQHAFLRSAYHVIDMGIFGSCVKGTLKKNSDIDVLVSFDQGRKVDLVIKEAVKPRLRDRILSEVRYVTSLLGKVERIDLDLRKINDRLIRLETMVEIAKSQAQLIDPKSSSRL